MKVYTELAIKKKNAATAIALGTFDGVHLGHQTVINEMKKYADSRSLEKTIVTFSDVPKQYGKEASLLISTEEKLAIFEKMAIDTVLIIPFNQQVKNMSAEDFYQFLKEKLNAKLIVVGKDFRFGYQARGDIQYLKRACGEDGIELIALDIVNNQQSKVSSSAIRKALQAGDISLANAMLGREHFFKGKVKTGKQLGKKIGFATANLVIANYMTSIKPGVYITKTKIREETYPSVSNVGYNPTFKQKDFNIETHILGFDRELYDETITVSFVKRLRSELSFNTIDELKAKIADDVQKTKEYYNMN